MQKKQNTYVRVIFTRSCPHTRSRAVPPYIKLPEADTPVGARIRTKEGDILAHILPPEVKEPIEAGNANAVFYTFNGKPTVRMLTGKPVRITTQESTWLHNNLPRMVEQLASDTDHDDGAIGRLVEEKKKIADEKVLAEGALAEAAKKLDDTATDLQREKTARAEAEKKIAALELELQKAQAKSKKSTVTDAKA